MRELQDIRVMYVTAHGGLAGVKEAWEKLESKIGSPKGRKFYGTYFKEKGEYRACVAMKEDDDPAALCLAVDTIPGGKYADSKLTDWSRKVQDIPLIFRELESKHDADDTRPGIEFYRSQRELILLLPVK